VSHLFRAGARLAALVLVLALCGCGSDDRLSTVPVGGKLTLDGKPVVGAEIWLVPAESNVQVKSAKMTVRPYAKSGPDGAFKLTSYAVDDGAPPGEYVAVVQKGGGEDPDDPDADPENPRPKRKGKSGPPLPTKYRTPTNSDLKVTIKDGPNEIELAMKSK
jgi:hypothetical protein